MFLPSAGSSPVVDAPGRSHTTPIPTPKRLSGAAAAVAKEYGTSSTTVGPSTKRVPLGELSSQQVASPNVLVYNTPSPSSYSPYRKRRVPSASQFFPDSKKGHSAEKRRQTPAARESLKIAFSPAVPHPAKAIQFSTPKHTELETSFNSFLRPPPHLE